MGRLSRSRAHRPWHTASIKTSLTTSLMAGILPGHCRCCWPEGYIGEECIGGRGTLLYNERSLVLTNRRRCPHFVGIVSDHFIHIGFVSVSFWPLGHRDAGVNLQFFLGTRMVDSGIHFVFHKSKFVYLFFSNWFFYQMCNLLVLHIFLWNFKCIFNRYAMNINYWSNQYLISVQGSIS